MNFKLVIIAGVLASAVLAGAQGAKAGAPPTGARGGFGRPGQAGGPGGQRRMMTVDERIKRMAKDLNLTPAQQKKLKPIFEGQTKKFKAIIDNKKLTDQQKRDAFMKLRDPNRKQVESVLTADQKKKYEDLRKQRMNRGGGPGGRGGAGRPAARGGG